LIKSSSFGDFNINNMNKTSKKVDFSIVEQRVEPLDVFTNISDCDLREFRAHDRKIQSSQERLTQDKDKTKCFQCKETSKKYFQAEGKYLKTLDRVH